jgi:hypothetical protein
MRGFFAESASNAMELLRIRPGFGATARHGWRVATFHENLRVYDLRLDSEELQRCNYP